METIQIQRRTTMKKMISDMKAGEGSEHFWKCVAGT